MLSKMDRQSNEELLRATQVHLRPTCLQKPQQTPYDSSCLEPNLSLTVRFVLFPSKETEALVMMQSTKFSWQCALLHAKACSFAMVVSMLSLFRHDSSTSPGVRSLKPVSCSVTVSFWQNALLVSSCDLFSEAELIYLDLSGVEEPKSTGGL